MHLLDETATENWRAVPGFEGRFECSDMGRVRSVSRMVACRNGGLKAVASRVLKPAIQTGAKGYRRASLVLWFEPTDPRRYAYFNVAVLVLTTFVGPRPVGLHACHNDGNSLNNRLTNLRWGTPAENMADRDMHGTTARGERSGSSKLTEEQVRFIRGSQTPGAHLAPIFGVSPNAVNAARRGKTWGHI